MQYYEIRHKVKPQIHANCDIYISQYTHMQSNVVFFKITNTRTHIVAMYWLRRVFYATYISYADI